MIRGHRRSFASEGFEGASVQHYLESHRDGGYWQSRTGAGPESPRASGAAARLEAAPRSYFSKVFSVAGGRRETQKGNPCASLALFRHNRELAR